MVSSAVCNLTIYWNVNKEAGTKRKRLSLVCNLTIYWNVNEEVIVTSACVATRFVI